MDPLDVALRFGSIAAAVAALGWSLLQYRLGARKAELTALDGKIATVAADLREHKEAGQDSRSKLDARLAQVEVRLEQLPDKDSVHRLDIAVTEIRGKIDTQGEALKAVGATASRVEEFLLKAAGSAQ